MLQKTTSGFSEQIDEIFYILKFIYRNRMSLMSPMDITETMLYHNNGSVVSILEISM